MHKKHLTPITHLLILTHLQPIQAHGAKKDPIPPLDQTQQRATPLHDTQTKPHNKLPHPHHPYPIHPNNTTQQPTPPPTIYKKDPLPNPPTIQPTQDPNPTIYTPKRAPDPTPYQNLSNKKHLHTSQTSLLTLFIICSYPVIPHQKNNPPTHQKPTLQVPQKQVVPKAQPKIKAQTNTPTPFYIPLLLLLLLLLLATALTMFLLPPLPPAIDLITHPTPEPTEYEVEDQDEDEQDEEDKETYKINYIHDTGKGGRKKSSSLLPHTTSKARDYRIYIVFKYARTPPKKKHRASTKQTAAPFSKEPSGRTRKIQINIPEKDRPDELAPYTGTCVNDMPDDCDKEIFAQPPQKFTLHSTLPFPPQVKAIFASALSDLECLKGSYTAGSY